MNKKEKIHHIPQSAPQESSETHTELETFNLKDRRAAKRFRAPTGTAVRILIDGNWQNGLVRDVSLSGLSFWFKTESRVDFRAALQMEIHLDNVTFRGAIRPVWFVSDQDQSMRFGVCYVEIDGYPELFECLTRWNRSERHAFLDRRVAKRRTELGTSAPENVLSAKTSRKISRRIENRLPHLGLVGRRVVVSAIGVVAPNGFGVKKFLQALQDGNKGIGNISLFDTSDFPCHLGGEVVDLEKLSELRPKELKRMERATVLMTAAVMDALSQGKIDLGRYNKYRTGTVLGTTVGGLGLALEQAEKFSRNGYRVMHPYGIAAASPNACSSEITARYKLKGPSFTFSQGCASAASAIAHGYDLIRGGKVDCVIVGGTDAPLIPSLYGAYCRTGLLSSDRSERSDYPRPYDVESTGTIISEGAACLVLEDLETALSFGHNIIAELAGYSSLTDGHPMMNHEPTGIEKERAIRFALEDSGIKPEDLSVIFGHGIGVKDNDISEYKALKRVFRGRLPSIPLATVKSMVGYTQGACAAIESVAACLALSQGFIPPVINTVKPYEGLNICSVRRNSNNLISALVNTFGFGGKNVCLVFKKFKQPSV